MTDIEIKLEEGWMLSESCVDTGNKHEIDRNLLFGVGTDEPAMTRCAFCQSQLFTVTGSFDPSYVNRLVSLERFVIRELP